MNNKQTVTLELVDEPDSVRVTYHTELHGAGTQTTLRVLSGESQEDYLMLLWEALQLWKTGELISDVVTP